MIKFVTGTANLDISGRLCREILSLLKGDSAGHIVYIVPEQFEYASERRIYRLLEENDVLNLSERVKVTTFSALSREVLDICSDTRPIADDIVKNVIMHKAIQGCAADLKTFGGICKRPGFSQQILSTIKGFKETGLSAEELTRSFGKINKPECELSKNTLLMNKLADVSLLYSEYSVNMKDYIDAPDITALAAKSLAKSGVLSGADIIVDCFNDFTGGQMKFIQSMIPAANSVMFGFTTDYDSENDVFQSANGNINAICGFAEKEDIKTEFVKDDIAPRSRLAAALSELSVKIFSDKRSDVPCGGSIELISASNTHEELDFVCSKIIALADDKELRYRDIAVLCTDLGSYGRYIESAFKKYDIPIFLDTHESILNQPLTNTVISILKAIEDFSADAVISCLKTGFFSKPKPPKDGEAEPDDKRVALSNFDINAFEDYVFEWAITTKHLMSPFIFPKNSDPDMIDYKKEAAETVRREAAVPLYNFSKKIPKGGIDGAKLTEMLYDFLMNDVDVVRALRARTINQDEDEDSTFDKESIELHTRIWNALMRIFNALHRELDGIVISIKDYTDMFRDLCSDTALSSPPQMADRVLVGDIDRTRADGIRAAFIVGATYDTFPTNFAQTGVFSQYEAELICSGISQIGDNEDNREIRIFKSAREQFALAKYRAYKAMTLPSEYLCITSPETDAEGEGTERSEVTYELSRMFTKGNERNLEVKKASSYTNNPDAEVSALDVNEFYCRSVQAAKSRYAFGLGADPLADAVLEEVLEKNDNKEFVDTLKEIRSEHSTDKTGAQTITPEQARLLFPSTISATQIEKLCSCPFAFFTGKGLNINERRTRTFNYSTRGTAIHYILEKVLSEYKGDTDKLCRLTRADFLRLSENYLREYCDRETNGDFSEDERSRFMFRNITHSAADVLISMQTEFFVRGYRPKFFELELNKTPETLAVPKDPQKPSAPPPDAELYSSAPPESAALPSPISAVNSDDTINTAPFVIKVDDTLSVLVTGRIDRVDMFTVETDADKKTYIRMVDYKSSDHAFSLKHAVNGLNVQMLLYMLAIIDANQGNPLNVAAGELSYISSKSSGASNEAVSPFMLLAGSHLGSNMFVKDDNLDSDLENYKKFIRDKMIAEDGKTALLEADIKNLTGEEMQEREKYKKSLNKVLSALDRNDENSVESKDFDALRAVLTENLTKKLGDLFNGNITAAPKATAKNKAPCEYCAMKSICKNGSLNIEVIPAKEKKPPAEKKSRSGKKKGAEE